VDAGAGEITSEPGLSSGQKILEMPLKLILLFQIRFFAACDSAGGHFPALRRRHSPISTILRAVRWAGALLVFGGFTLDFVRGSDEQAN